MALILVVDDDLNVRLMMRARFEQAGHTVLEANSGPRALEMIEAGPVPDAILCDVFMPGMDGLDCYRHLISRRPQLRHRVIVISAGSRDPQVYRDVELLGIPLLSKTDDLQLVLDAVQVALLRPLEPEVA